MAQLNYYSFRIRKDINNYYAFLNGSVQLLAAPSNPELETIFDLNAIVNFSDEGIRWARHPDWHGVFTSYSESLKFAGDALQIVQNIFYQFDIEAVAQLEVRRCNPSFNGYTGLYKPYFIGDIDFSTFVPEVDDNGKAFIALNIKQGGTAAILKSSENIPYRIGLDLIGKLVYMDGITLRDNFLWSPIGGLDIPVGTSTFGFATIIPSAFLSQESEYYDGIGNTPFYEFVPDGSAGTPTFDDNIFDNFYLFKGTIDIPNAQFAFKVQATIYNDSSNVLPSQFSFKLLHIGKDKTLISAYLLYRTPGNIAVGATLTVEIDVSSPLFSMSEGDELFLVGRFDLGVSGTLNLTQNPTDSAGETWKYNLYVEFKPKPTITNTISYHDAADALITQILGSTGKFQSDFLSDPFKKVMDNYPARTMLTAGDSLRRLPDAGMQMTLDDLFKDFTARWCGGLGVENDIVRLEPIQHFYQDVEIAYFENISNFRAVPDLSMRGNVLKVGMDDQSYDSLNGKDEANGTQTYKLPFIRTIAQLDQTSGFRSDAIGIESIRSNLTAKTTTDNSGDNEVFVLSISEDYFSDTIDGVLLSHIYYLLRRNNEFNTTGILFPETHYNLDLYPKRNFWRNAPLISIYCWKRDGETITFQTLDKNKNLISNLNASGLGGFSSGDGEVVETSTVLLPLSNSAPVPDSGSRNIQTTPVFLPMLPQFTAEVSETFSDAMAVNPYGYIRVNWNGIDYKGFINKAACINSERNSYDFELRAHPDSDFSQLSYA